MMVSKVAVIALISILAIPILLGYGMNFTETTETGYKQSESGNINLTPYLENGNTGSAYSYTHSDITTMNSDFRPAGRNFMMPFFIGTSSTNTSFPRFQEFTPAQTYDSYDIVIDDYKDYYIEFQKPSVMSVALYRENGDWITTYYNSVVSVYVEHKTLTNSSWVMITKSGTDTITSHAGSGTGNYVKTIRLWSSSVASAAYSNYLYKDGSGHDNDSYVDLSKGYYFYETYKDNSGLWPNVRLPDYTKQITITMNLDSITDANYALHLNTAPYNIYTSTIPYTYIPIELKKTTVGSDVKWTLRNEFDSSAAVTELYTDPALSDNTYQFTITPDCIYNETTHKYYLEVNVKASYVGSWPTLIGIANSYIDYDLEYVIRDDPRFIYNSPLTDDDLTIYNLYFNADGGARTPIMRMDDALYRAFEYNTITDRTFNPINYVEDQTNPTTTITVLNKFGTSLSFGGHVYAINKGKITIEGHSIPANSLILASVLNESGTYDNTINNTVVSTTAQPSDITLGGSWSASVSVSKMESYTYTKTEWIPGQFAWDGIETNFLMVGLMTSLGAFIGLAIYSRRSRTSLWPLLLVCGGAAMLFLFML